MIKELLNVIRTTKGRHIINAMSCPSHTMEAFKYHYRIVDEARFIKFLAAKLKSPKQIVNSAYHDLHMHKGKWDKMLHGLSTTPKSRGAQMTIDGPSLYLLMRLLRPNTVVETGVAAGVSSHFILQALQDNGGGHLYSVDLLPEVEECNKMTGWLVPDDLRQRWELNIADAKEILPGLLERLQEIDCFIHDSLHTYEHMLWEFRVAWPHLRSGGLFLAHDVGTNQAFFDFMKERGIRWSDYRVHGLLGGLQKNSSKL
jgi:predicted O-methyltransferase YrrM